MANRLASATSPYLLQHAENPVDWYEWGHEALARARELDRPILLSVGYAACHWCHVMAHESFEDPETARVMNESFVCVKVDREERPDLDAIYMDAVQAMTGQGGWPMTVFLTPSGEPFFAGTYFPPEDRHGMPGFRRVLAAVLDAWRERRSSVNAQGQQVLKALNAASTLAASREPLTERLLQAALSSLTRAHDQRWGGFGSAPKFPQSMTLELLLRLSLRRWDGELEMAVTTLDRMASGGIHDQLAGGFHRYSTDARWLVPHFEKMLYDNAQLASLYLHAWQLTGEQRWQRVCRSTLDYILRDLALPDGGFASSEDADSEGVEGRFYVWSWEELVSVAGEAAARYFGAAPEGNWEGVNVLWTPEPSGLEAPAVEDARRRLLERRGSRVRPGVDDKVLVAWNTLAVQALAEGGRAFGERRYVEAALAAADFILGSLRRSDGRLLRAWRAGRTSGPAYLDDYAGLASACLSLYMSTFDVRWFKEARGLADEMVRLFADRDRGGFFQTGSDAEELIVRPKDLMDNAVPSGNSSAADLLQRLALLTGDAEYERLGVSALRLVRDLMERAPTGMGNALCALDLYLGPSREVAVVGELDSDAARALVDVVWRRYLPNVVVAASAPEDQAAAEAVALLAGRGVVDGRAAAYVCERFVCRRPTSEPAELESLLGVARP
jgi:uncharacterized protein YyaL (SSP411 family)